MEVPTNFVSEKSETDGAMLETAPLRQQLARVSELILLLSGLSSARKSVIPHPLEARFAEEAYSLLAPLVSAMAPSELASKEAVTKLCVDLGFREKEEEKMEAEVSVEAASTLAEERPDDVMESAVDEVQEWPSFPSEAENDGQAFPNTVTAMAPPIRIHNLPAEAAMAPPSDSPFAIRARGRPPKVLQPATLPQVQWGDSVAAHAVISQLHLPSQPSKQIQLQQQVLTQLYRLSQQPGHGLDVVQKGVKGGTHLIPQHLHYPVVCQTCKKTDSSSVQILMCDSCERAYHLHCLQPFQRKNVTPPPPDWYCPKCSFDTQGRPRPPKYCVVKTRATGSTPAPVQSQPLPVPQTQTPTQLPLPQHHTQPRPQPQPQPQPLLQVQAQVQAQGQGQAQPQSRTQPPSSAIQSDLIHQAMAAPLQQYVQPAVAPPVPSAPLSGIPQGHETPAAQVPTHQATPGTDLGPGLSQGNSESHSMRIKISGWKEGRRKKKADTEPPSGTASAPEGSHGHGQGQDEEWVSQNRDASAAMTAQPAGQSGHGVQEAAVEAAGWGGFMWVGNPDRVEGENVYYSGCQLGAVRLRLRDCAMFRPESEGMLPYVARIQSMWHNVKDGTKWCRVSWCYYPADLPAMEGRPLPVQPDEVYESNHCDDNLLESVWSLCVVMPWSEYQLEVKRREIMAVEGVRSIDPPPLYLARFKFDVNTTMFQPIEA